LAFSVSSFNLASNSPPSMPSRRRYSPYFAR
jgi:hypothetical protein